MLKFIKPKEQKSHKSSINAYLDLLTVYQNFNLSETRRKKSTFLIAEDKEHGVYGGALLYPHVVREANDGEVYDDYEHTFCCAFEDFRPHISEFWMARICFCLEANFSPSGLEGLNLCEKFYSELYKSLTSFGHSKEAEFLALSLCSFDTIDPPLHKKWPYLLPIWRSDDTSGLFHGILSLNKTKFMPVKKREPKTVLPFLKKDKSESVLAGRIS